MLKFVGLIGFPIIFVMYLIEKNALEHERMVKQNKENLYKKTSKIKKL